MNAVDIGIIVVLLSFCLLGLRKGFVISIFNLLGFIVSLYIAKIYYPVVSRYLINNTKLYVKINNFISQKVSNSSSESQSTESILDIFKLPKSIKEGMFNSSYDSASSVQNNVSDYISNIIIIIISFFIVFIVAKMVLHIAVSLLNTATKLPGLNEVNKLLGFLLGGIKGVLIVYIIFAVLTPVITMYPDSFIANNTINSKLGYYFYTNNLIIKYLKTFMI